MFLAPQENTAFNDSFPLKMVGGHCLWSPSRANTMGFLSTANSSAKGITVSPKPVTGFEAYEALILLRVELPVSLWRGCLACLSDEASASPSPFRESHVWTQVFLAYSKQHIACLFLSTFQVFSFVDSWIPSFSVFRLGSIFSYS